MSFSLQRVWRVPHRLTRSFLAANHRHLKVYLSTETPVETTKEDNDANDNDSELFESTKQEDYGHYISQKPETEFGRKMRVFMPARSAGTQGVAKVGMWKVEPMNPGKRWGNPLMGWTSTRDPMQSMNHGLDRFETKQNAIQWCISNGYDFEISEPKIPRRKPKNYASTMGRNGVPVFEDDTKQ